jgi:peptidoglycan/xylan/chitin deacetylase (PgdA/CDA1 family)
LRKYRSYLVPVFIVAIIVSCAFFLGQFHSSTSATDLPGAETISALPELTITPTETAPPSLGVSLPILMYHEIGDGPNSLYVSVDNFRAQMHFLRDSGFQAITMAQAQQWLARGQVPAKTVVLTFDDGYVSVYNNAWPILQECGFPATVYVCSSFSGLYNYLTWDQIQILHAGGVEIGSHTQTHPALTSVSSAQLSQEIVGSKQMLEQHLGAPVYSFCYPCGAFNQYTPPVVKAAGYTSAVTVVSGAVTTQNDPFQLPRIRVPRYATLSAFADFLR